MALGLKSNTLIFAIDLTIIERYSLQNRI
jgi:hypothetical protein